jgi:hypothetical protein
MIYKTSERGDYSHAAPPVVSKMATMKTWRMFYMRSHRILDKLHACDCSHNEDDVGTVVLRNNCVIDVYLPLV